MSQSYTEEKFAILISQDFVSISAYVFDVLEFATLPKPLTPVVITIFPLESWGGHEDISTSVLQYFILTLCVCVWGGGGGGGCGKKLFFFFFVGLCGNQAYS